MNAIKKPENWCAIAMICFFFLPWTQLLGINGSGYELSKLGSYGNWAWVIPIAAIVTLAISIAGNEAKPLHILTGLLPYVGVAYGLSQAGKDLFHFLAIGVYLTLVAGLFMIMFATGVLGTKGVEATTTSEGIAEQLPRTRKDNLPAVAVIFLIVIAAVGYGGYSFVQDQREKERVKTERLAQEEFVRQQEQERIRQQQEWQRQQQFQQARRQEQIEEQRRTQENHNLTQIAMDAFRRKQYDDGLPPLIKAAERGYAVAQNNLAWFYATSPESRYRDGASAVRFAEYAVQQEPNAWNFNGTLAAAYARNGDFTKAVQFQERAINLLRENFQISNTDRDRYLEAAKLRRALYSGTLYSGPMAFTEP
jgi:hypothetical protein